ncbi:hypothetical protein CASFOL_023816 [Castilleja foliolosa]|uniref:DUF642 domain-containing protein n=1 Tax=Castilleja foliolosa TaxID=1961234 RepID=A0ABD3CMY6_9LAMI
MIWEPDVVIWGALLSVCKECGNIEFEVAERVIKDIRDLDPENHGVYVVLSIMYAEAERWEDELKRKERDVQIQIEVLTEPTVNHSKATYNRRYFMKLHTILISCIFLATVFADILQNPDFGLPPSNWNTSFPFFTLDANSSTIPGWSFEGTVQYVTAGANLSLPQNGRAILLGPDGKINQTFTANGEQTQYLLTFVLSRNCSTHNASLLVSAPDSSAEFSLTGKYGRELWEVYGHWVGSWGGGESINLVIESQAVDVDENSTCWPVVGALDLVTVGSVKQESDNLLLNGGFESGPAFPEFSNNGLLLNSEPSLTESALQQWTVTGTVKYINSKNHFIPEGKAAIEIVSGISSGIQTAKQLNQGSTYNLDFLLGDANDSCVGDFTVGVAAGSSVENFTIRSNGSGSAQKHSLPFNGAGTGPTTISFQSYTTGQREDGVFCGPVIDGVILRASGVRKLNVSVGLLMSLIFVALVKI